MPALTRLSDVRSLLPKRAVDANKGDRGRVLLVAGSKGMTGAGALSALGAVRAGAGLVRWAVAETLQPLAASLAPLEVTTHGLPDDRSGHLSGRAGAAIEKLIEEFKADVVAIGPGLGQMAGVKAAVRGLLSRTVRPVVLDADGLNVCAGGALLKKRACPLIITPHPGELSRLLDWSIQRIQAQRADAAERAARLFRCVCVLKGAGTIVSNGRETWKNTTGNPGMASGGAGDVLTGIVAALWAQLDSAAASALSVARLGVFLHGLAGDIATADIAEASLTASDIPRFLSAAFKKCGGT